MFYFCCNERRRDAVRHHPNLNGIDYLEVLDSNAPTTADRQLILLVYLLKPLGSLTLTEENIRIEGGNRIRNIQATEITTFSDARVFRVRVDKWGDFSTYTLCLVASAQNPQQLDGFDPLLQTVDFSFKVECPSDFDCKTERVCPPEPQPQPEINYLAKDYASFRQLMLDRMALLMPQWRERNPADLGIALVELLAYVGDYLSYQQDAIATEAYLLTARRRTSVRRHARLVDYFMHDGCNGRVWAQVWVNADLVRPKPTNPNEPQPPSPLPKGTKLLTQLPGQPPRLSPNSSAVLQALATTATVFETMHDLDALYQSHNEMYFYTWGDSECCLPKGATRASLRSKDNQPLHLAARDVLIFMEQRGPKTGKEADADLTHRHAVRLTQVEFTKDPLPTQPVQVVNIRWHPEDALPFPLCLGEVEDQSQPGQQQISIALGNIVLADHGLTTQEQQIKDGENYRVPSVKLFRVPISAGDRCQPSEPKPLPPRFNPRLQQAPLTQTARVKKIDPVTEQQQLVHFDPEASASAAFQWQMEDTIPAITLHERDSNDRTWCALRDLLGSKAFDPHFVAEVEGDGFATLRFGNGQLDRSIQLGQHGLRPSSGTAFDATYRVGNGRQGNIGAETLAHIVIVEPRIDKVRNPLPAKGGIDPESIEDVRQRAPSAFRTQERAVTPEDYAAVAERYSGMQRAAATFRWTGSWRTVFLTVDRLGGEPVDATFEEDMRRHIERFRMAGHDLEIDGPRYVSLEIEMQVCVKPNYFRSQVKAALLEVFSNRILPDGRGGVFHADNFTFGQPVYLSRLYAAAQAVDGVASVQVTTFQRHGTPSTIALTQGKLELGRLEIARLDNDPNFPDRGVFRLKMEGGK